METANLMKRPSDIPDSLWRTACETVHHAVAVTDVKHFFIWANEAYCLLVGYSLAQLQKMQWQDITISADVPGDLESVTKILSGEQNAYSMSKRYRHQLGHEVPVSIMVWRFPPSGRGEPVLAVVTEAIPQGVSKEEFSRLHKACYEKIESLEQRLGQIERIRESAMKSRLSRTTQQHGDSNIFNVGNNSTEAVKYLIGAVVVISALIFGATKYLSYLSNWPHHHGQIEPPKDSIPFIPEGEQK